MSTAPFARVFNAFESSQISQPILYSHPWGSVPWNHLWYQHQCSVRGAEWLSVWWDEGLTVGIRTFPIVEGGGEEKVWKQHWMITSGRGHSLTLRSQTHPATPDGRLMAHLWEALALMELVLLWAPAKCRWWVWGSCRSVDLRVGEKSWTWRGEQRRHVGKYWAPWLLTAVTSRVLAAHSFLPSQTSFQLLWLMPLWMIIYISLCRYTFLFLLSKIPGV